MKTLLFATTYVDSLDKRRMLELWLQMMRRSRGCDVMIIDSASTMLPHIPLWVQYYTFRSNIGHLSRGGQDGWGRAFSRGLEHAERNGYDYVAHVEGDSLFKLDLGDIIEEMELSDTCVASIPVSSMPSPTWIETGLMVMSVDWLRGAHFTERYDWESRTKHPEPEVIVRSIIGNDLSIQAWRGMRDDFHELTVDNLEERNLDWLTHASLPVMEKFAA